MSDGLNAVMRVQYCNEDVYLCSIPVQYYGSRASLAPQAIQPTAMGTHKQNIHKNKTL